MRTSMPEFSVRDHWVQKLLSEHTDTHTRAYRSSTWTTRVVSK